ncbi:MAG: PEP-CTERM sorting domain-containing protein [Planctomycetes bacterium]|nr:PEP-CTERM sorting domain-containing protein [Planctomycetota bacterium]
MYLKSAVNTGGQNTGTIIHQFSDTVVDLDGGQSIRLALEVRDGAGEDVRMAYQKRIDGQWGEWTTSAWFDPTAAALGVNALASDWKNTWNESTYLYLEQNGRTSYTRTIYVDDVLVTGVPEPATMGLLLLGSMGVFVRRRTGR